MEQYQIFETPECYNCTLKYTKYIQLPRSDIIIKVCDNCIKIYSKFDPFADIMIHNKSILHELENLI